MTLWAAIFPVVISYTGALTFSHKAIIDGTIDEHFNLTVFNTIAILGLLVAIFMQIGVNYANDYYDNQHEIFAKTRPVIDIKTAKSRFIGSFAIACAFGVALVSTAPLSIVAKCVILALGALCIITAVNYSGGINYASKAGFADIISGLFFGPVSILMLYYVLTNTASQNGPDMASLLNITLKSLSIGIVISGMLMLDNIRDIDTDPEKGKHTLQSRIGLKRSILLYKVSILIAVIIALLLFRPFIVTIATILFLFVTLVSQQSNLKDLNFMRAFKFNVLIGLALTLIMIF